MTPLRGRMRRFWFGLQTISGVRRRGYFAPSRHAASAEAAACLSPALEARFAARGDAMRENLAALDAFKGDFAAIGKGDAPAPRWNQDWFPRLDAAMAYAMVRRVRPRRIVEVGSGHSTRFFCRAVQDGGLETDIVAIDPEPRAATGAFPRLTMMAAPVQDVGVAPFGALGAGDILSIDSSHVLMPGSDVDFLMNAVLPSLPTGVLIHFHDIFLPDPYPESWAWRGYNEQTAVALLIHAAGWRIEFASCYAVTRLAGEVSRSVVSGIALPAGAYESSLWLAVGDRKGGADS